MTERLEQAIARLKIVPTDRQDAIATLILEELEAEQRWDESFARSPDLLAKLAAEAIPSHPKAKSTRSEAVQLLCYAEIDSDPCDYNA